MEGGFCILTLPESSPFARKLLSQFPSRGGGVAPLSKPPQSGIATFLANMQELFGEEYESFLDSYSSPSLRGLRVNLKKVKKCSKPFAFTNGLEPIPWCDSGYYYHEELCPSKTIYYHAGLFYIQEPSAMCPAEVLDVKPQHRVLDLCAAPGGKSVQIGGYLSDEGLLFSNDASPSRSRALVNNLERAGMKAIVTTEQPYKIANKFPNFFDRILVDAPCSGEGMFRRDPEAIKAYTSNKPESCAIIQKEILHHASKMLKPGGKMVYSTCTFNTLENEGTITEFLSTHKDFSLLPINHEFLGVSQGKLPETARIFPHHTQGEGHFIALLQKNENNENKKQTIANEVKEKTKIPEAFLSFCNENLYINFPSSLMVAHGVNLYLQPESINLSGLRVARSGLFLGENVKGRFTPSQALAMYLAPSNTRYNINLSEENAWRYLHGETLTAPDDLSAILTKPWVQICYEGYPLGWARLVQGRLKNKLPVGWVVS